MIRENWKNFEAPAQNGGTARAKVGTAVPTQNRPKLKNWQNVGTARANVGTARAKLLHHIPSKKFFAFPIHSLLS